jgi:tripartite-type tricarboxylate transporter receptor subunit TctC
MKAMTLLSCLAAAAMIVPGPAKAAYPDKPIRILVPFPAGGASDAAARAIGQSLARSFAQPVVVENRPGANGAIAAQAAHSAAPDGYTLLWAPASMTALPALMRNPPFASLSEFSAIGTVGDLPYCVYVSPQLGARSMADFVAYARANPSKVSYGTGSLGEYQVADQFLKLSGVTMERIPYKGGAQLMPDLVAGRIQFNIGPASTGLPYVKAGRLRALAMLTPQRSPLLPDVPTAAEAGFAGLSVASWQALVAPPKTPRPIVEKLAKAVDDALRDPGTISQLEKTGFHRAGSTPEELDSRIRRDYPGWTRFIRENNVEIE